MLGNKATSNADVETKVNRTAESELREEKFAINLNKLSLNISEDARTKQECLAKEDRR